MAVQLSPEVFWQKLDADGLNLANGYLYTYITQTTTPQATWTDATESQEATNPIRLDASGRIPGLWLTVDLAYTLYLTDENGGDGRTIDDVILQTPATEIAPTPVDIYQLLNDADPPTTNMQLFGETFRRPITWPAGFLNSGVVVNVAPTAEFVMTCRKNSTSISDGTQVGTCTIQTNKDFAFTTTGDVEFTTDIGDWLDWYGPVSADASIQGFKLTMVGRVTGTAPGDLVTQDELEAAVAAAILAAIVPGTVTMWGGSTVPDGFLECNGAAVSRSTYSALFTKIGTTWGIGNGTTTFNLPDLRGVFVRGWDHGRGIDTGRDLEATNQADAFQGFYMSPLGATSAFLGPNGAGDWAHSNGSTVIRDATTGGPVDDGVHGTPRIASETRPINLAMMFIIRTGV